MSIEENEVEHVEDALDADGPLSLAVVAAVADATGQSPLEMDPLWENIDCDALDALMTPTGESDSSMTVTFSYCDCRVTVTSDEIQIDHSE